MTRSTPNILDYQKHGLSLTKNQADLARNRVELIKSEPGPYDAEIGALNDFQKSSQTRKPGWKAVLDGLIDGLKYSANSAEGKRKKQIYENAGKWMESVEATNRQAQKINAANEQKAMQREIISPLADDLYASMSGNVPREALMSSAQQALHFLIDKGIAAPNSQLTGIDPVSKKITYNDPNGPEKVFNVTPYVSEEGFKAVEQSINQRGADARMMSSEASRRNAETHAEYADTKYGLQKDRISETRRRNDQNATKSDIKLNETLGKKIDADREFLTIAPKMQEIVQKYPDIFQSAMDVVWREQKEPGFTSSMLKSAQNSLNPDKVAALTSMVKYINKMALDVAGGFSRPNMFIEKIGSKAVPNLDMNPQGFEKVLDEMVAEKRTAIKNNQRRLELFASDAGLPDQLRQSTQGVMEGEPQNGPDDNVSDDNVSIVTIRDPDTGEVQDIPAHQLDAAVLGGWEPIQNG